MSQENSDQALSTAWDKLTGLWYQYAQLILKDLEDAWKDVNQKFGACYADHDGSLTTDKLKIDAAVQAVTTLETACAEAATRNDAHLEVQPIPSHLQMQPLTEEDNTFAQKQRIALAEVSPEVGVLDVYFETGTEGAYWSIEVNGLEGYESLRILRGGDRLVIYHTDGSVLFDEILIEDHISGWEPYQVKWPYGLGQQACAGLWVHWIPKGWSPQKWAELRRKAQGGRAELYRLDQSQNKAET